MSQIPVAAIDVPPDFVVRDEAAMDQLYFSLKALGQLQPIGVVAHPDLPGRYRLIWGAHRAIVIRDRLRWEHIDATVRSYTEVQAEMATLSENLHRAELGAAERDRAMRRYAELYGVIYPEVAAAIRSRQNANLKHVAPAPAGDDGAEPAPIVAVARALGVSDRTVRRGLARAKLTDDQRDLLDARDLGLNRIARIGTLEDDQRNRTVNLIASGMGYEDAMAEVLGDDWEGDPQADTGLSDAEFLAACPARAHANLARFDRAALLYRRLRPARIAFQRAIDWPALKPTLNFGDNFSGRLLRFLSTRHPREWVHCGACVRGMTNQGECPKCRGGGFLP
jgi:ParB/RepB/Spo0J family partition protein